MSSENHGKEEQTSHYVDSPELRMSTEKKQKQERCGLSKRLSYALAS
jgi:hypothetical protein